MRPFASLSRHGQIRRLRRAAETALAEYADVDARLTFLSDRGNLTFRVDAPPHGTRFLLRVYDPGKSSRAAVLSELAWLKALDAAAEGV